jgi:hypothetical protein
LQSDTAVGRDTIPNNESTRNMPNTQLRPRRRLAGRQDRSGDRPLTANDDPLSGTFSQMSIVCQVAMLRAGWRGTSLRQGIDPGDGPHRDSLVLGKASLTHLEMSRS